MKRTNSWLWFAALSLLLGTLLSNCGGDGGVGERGVVIQERVAYLRVIDANTKEALNTTVLFLTDQGELSFRRIVAGQAQSQGTAALSNVRQSFVAYL